ncbi:mitochondrial sodium/calcium exchanger protein-like isoform X2 [Anneissia japonica]|uniref:mitochondrial sodium/calcium exchanger protein-like isoform X2 n=1 Tax=Anneissia japonica TaxID=1529436 RepID=UPI0014255967|nr:mitochondrial sodium/calcium exchanger protein-like isoform X2 [Anneissia japonica]
MSKKTAIKSFTAVSFFATTLGIISLARTFSPERNRIVLANGYSTNFAWRSLLSYNDSLRNEEIKCKTFHDVNFTERCNYIKHLPDCQTDDGFINYIRFVYCAAPTQKYVIPILLFLLCWLFFLFISLGATAEDFFCPSLNVISRTLGLSQNVAGVTFLAFGNGAPDIFSLVAAISESKNGDAGLAIGALFGAGIFVTTMVAGSIAWVSTFQIAERPFLRDAIFYIAAVYWTYHVLWYETINLATSIGLLGLYAFYVVVVIIGRKINQATRNRNSPSLTDPTTYTQPEDSTQVDGQETRQPADIRNGLTATQILVASSAIARSASPHMIEENSQVHTHNQESNSELLRLLGGGRKPVDKTMLRLFIEGVCPINLEDWKDLSIPNKIYEVVKAPIQLLLLLTIPVVDYDVEKHNWNKPLNTLHIIFGPMLFIFATKLSSKSISGGFVAWHLVLCICVVIAILVFLTSKKEQQPKYHPAYAYLGFLVAVIWIYSIANEIVNVLQMYGSVLKVSEGILGLTLLAWGNSIGDLISNTTMARQGFPRMAISACFGGPLFNMLVGIGIACTVKIVTSGKSCFQINHTNLQDILALFLLLSLLSSLFIMLVAKFKASRAYSAFLFSLYALFLTFAILVETNVISWEYTS